MSTQALLDKIVAGQNEQVAQIETDTAAAVAQIEADTKETVAQITSDAAAASEKEVAQITRAALSKARQAGKLIVQTARRKAFDDIMATAQQQIVGDDAKLAQQFSDQKADLEMELSKQLG